MLVVQVFGLESISLMIGQEEKERYLSAEPAACPICGAHLQGHGWRNRYVAGLNGCILILVHRKRCPNCKMTFTLLPKGLHSMRVHDVETIYTAIRSFFEAGHYINSISVSKSLRKSWTKAFLKRNGQGEARGKDELIEMLGNAHNAFLAAPLALKELAKGEIWSRQNLERYRVPHHRLLLGLCIPSG